MQVTLTPPDTQPSPSTPNPTPRKQLLPGFQSRKRKREPPCFGRNKYEKLVCGAKLSEGFKQLRESKTLKSADELISAAKKLQDQFAVSSTSKVEYPLTSICRAVVFDIWAADDPLMKDPKVPSYIKRAAGEKEAKRLQNQRNRAMLKSIVLYAKEVGLTDPEAMQRLKDFSRTLKPVDTSCDQNRPSDLEFVTYLGELFNRDEQILHAKFKTKHLRRMGPKRPVMW